MSRLAAHARGRPVAEPVLLVEHVAGSEVDPSPRHRRVDVTQCEIDFGPQLTPWRGFDTVLSKSLRAGRAHGTRGHRFGS